MPTESETEKSMNDIITGAIPYIIPMLWIGFGLFGYLAYIQYWRGQWRRWTMRYSVIGCLIMNVLLLVIFTASRSLNIYLNDWTPLSTSLMIVCLFGICVFHVGLLIKHWSSPIWQVKKRSDAI